MAVALPCAAEKAEINVVGFGEVRELLGDRQMTVDSLFVRGPIDATDFRAMYEASLNGRLKYLNLKDAAAKDGFIPDNAFWDSSLQSTSEWTARAIQLETLILPDNTVKIGYNSCKLLALKDFQLPSSVREFSSFSFHNATLGTGVLVIPEGVEAIATYAFSGVRGVTALNLPSSLRDIKNAAFSEASFEDVNLKEGLQSIGVYAFSGCRYLRKATIPESCTSIGAYAFNNLPSAKEIIMGSGTTEIPAGFAYMGSELEHVKLPEKAEVIGYEAFAWCENLKGIKLPDTMREIGEDAFYGAALDSIVLPEGVAVLRHNAFATLSSPAYIRCYSSLPPSCETAGGEPTPDIFGSAMDYSIPLYVPVGSRDAYGTATGWSRFTNVIEFDTSGTLSVEGIEENSQAPRLRVEPGGVVISPAGNMDTLAYTVYSLSGGVMVSGCCGSGGLHIPLDKGTYIVKAGNLVKKVRI